MIRKYQNTIIRSLVIIVLFLLQMAFVILLPRWLKMNALLVYFLIEMFSVVLMFSLVADNANSSYRIFWMGVVLLLPITGHVMYEFWGKEGAKKKQHKAIQKTIDFYRRKKDENTQMKYFPLGEFAFECLMSDLKKAEKFNFFSFFTIADGEIWNAISDILFNRKSQTGHRN